ncbi:MAG: hypothetical protein WAM89_06100 [Terriglobales bacterium]
MKLPDRGRSRPLMDAARGRATICAAVVHPPDAAAIVGAIEAAKSQLIIPAMVGAEIMIRAAAQQASLCPVYMW